MLILKLKFKKTLKKNLKSSRNKTETFELSYYISAKDFIYKNLHIIQMRWSCLRKTLSCDTKILINICHKSSYISSKHLIYYIFPFSIASYKTWSFFDPRKVLQFHINRKYSCNSAYMIWLSDIFLHYISCCIFSWANCPHNLFQKFIIMLSVKEFQLVVRIARVCLHIS